MKKENPKNKSLAKTEKPFDYEITLAEFVTLLESSRRASARAINSVITPTYWEIGRRIVEIERGGEKRAEYGEGLLKQLAKDLTARFGRGFSERNLEQMRLFYSKWQISQTVSAKFDFREIAEHFPLSWSHYVKLLATKTDEARKFYESEALRGGWSVRQLERQINSLFFERALLSKNKMEMLKKGEKVELEDTLTADEEIRDPFVLEFLNLKDEYSEFEPEDAIIKHLENFYSSSEQILLLSADKNACGLTMNGFGSIWFFIIANFAV